MEAMPSRSTTNINNCMVVNATPNTALGGLMRWRKRWKCTAFSLFCVMPSYTLTSVSPTTGLAPALLCLRNALPEVTLGIVVVCADTASGAAAEPGLPSALAVSLPARCPKVYSFCLTCCWMDSAGALALPGVFSISAAAFLFFILFINVSKDFLIEVMMSFAAKSVPPYNITTLFVQGSYHSNIHYTLFDGNKKVSVPCLYALMADK